MIRDSSVHRRAVTLGIAVALMVVLTGFAAGVYRNEGSTGMIDEATQTGIDRPGLGSFMFSGAAAVRDHPIRVWYIAPEGDLSTAQILVVIPGAQRDGESYRSDWVPLVEDRNVVVIVPDFESEAYDDTSYNLGNLMDDDDDARPEEEWSFTAIEALFDQVVSDVRSEAKQYDMFGHSAGSQFVHRFMEFTTDNRVRTAVAANAGWYTFPDDSEDFPYGLDESPLREEDMGSAFASDLVVLLGADDIDPDDDKLRHDDGSDAQGANRLERGVNFYLKARDTAEDQSLPFRWQLRVVPGIGHDHTEMAKVAAPLVLDAR